MKTLKTISIFFLLIVITCGVVFVPQLISKHKEEKILKEIVYHDYYAGNRPKLTSKQVALFYYSHKIDLGYNSLPISDDNSNIYQENVIGLIELMFGEDEAVCEPIKKILAESDISYSRNSSIIKIDNQGRHFVKKLFPLCLVISQND